MIFKTIGEGDTTKVVTALQARKIAQEELNTSLAKQAAVLETDSVALKQLEINVAQGIPYEQAFAQSMTGASAAAKEHAIATKGAAGSTEVFVAKQKAAQTELKATSAAAKGAGIAMKALSIAGNMLLFTAITTGISLLTKAIDDYIHASENAVALTDELKSKHQEIQSEYESHKQTVEELASSYERLSKGVDTLTNKNIDLSDEDYEEYLRITNELVEAFPSLYQTLDDNGNAILTLGQNGRTASEDLQELLKAEEDLNNYKISQDIEGLFGGVKVQIDEAKKSLDEYKESSDEMENAFQTLKDLSADGIDLFSNDNLSLSVDTSTQGGVEYYNALTRALQNFNAELDANRRVELDGMFDPVNVARQTGDNAFEFYLNLWQLTDEEKQQLQNEIKAQATDILPLVQDEISSAFTEQSQKQQEADLAWRDFLPSLVATMKSQGSFKDLADDAFGEDIQNFAIDMVSNLDRSVAEEMDKTDPYGWVRNNIILPLTKLDDADRQSVSEAYKKLLELNPNDLSGVNRSAIDELIKTLATLLGQTEDDVRLNLGFEVDEDLQTKYDNAIGRIVENEKKTVDDLKVKYQEAIDKRKELYSGSNYVGNVDINNRSVVINDDGSYSTTSTAFQEKWIGDKENGSYKIIHYTPILPDGTILEDGALDEYIDRILNASDSLAADNPKNGGYGIVYKVDTEVNGKKITDSNLDEAFGIADAWDIEQHELQDKMYRDEAKIKTAIEEFGNSVDSSKTLQDFFSKESIDTTTEIDYWNSVTEGAKSAEEAIRMYNEAKAEKPDETSISSIIDSWNSLIDTDVEELKNTRKDLLELAEAGQLTAETFHDTTGADTFLDGISESLPEVIEWINQLVSSSTQLQSMSAQISKMSDMLADKKNGTTASASDLAGFDVTVKGLESWEEFERVMGSSKSSMEECQAAADALATEWVNNGNFLANLTEENKDYYTHQLKSMGIENAAVVVTEALAGKKEALRLKYVALNAVLTDFEGKTNGACARLLEQENASDQTRQALADLVSQEILFNNSSLDVSGKISALNQLALAAYGVSEALNSGMGLDSRYYNGQTAEERIAEKWSIMSSAQKVASSQISISPNGSSNYKTKGSKDNNQTIDWIKRLLDVLQKKIDATKAKFENLFTLKDKKNNLAKQLTLTKNLLTATTTAANRYKKAADKVSLSSDLKKKVREGSYDINEYDSKTAEKIQKYENFYDQYKELLQKADELTTDIRNLQIEQYQLVVDNAEAKIARSQARAELDAGNYKEQNKHLEYQKKYLKEQYEAEIEIAKVKKDKVEVARLEAELQKELNDLTKQEFDNIANTYDNKIGLADNKIQAFQSQIDLLEARGQQVGSALYTKQMTLNDGKTDKLLAEKDALIKKLAEIPKGKDSWYEAQSKLFDVDQELVNIQIDNANLQKSINQLKFDRFDDLLAKLNDIVDETDFLIDMLDSDNFYDDNGKITDDGITAMGMYAQKRDVYKAESEKYKQMQAELNQMYANGDIGIVDYEDLSRKYKQGQMDMAKAAEDMNKSIINLVSDGLEKQNQALSESIQKQKDLLRAEKDLKSFQDSLSDANKNVSRLERQYEILSGDDSEENRKRLREIKSQLEDAKKSRDDLLYDKSIDDQEKNLDDMYDAAVKSSEEYLKDSTKVLIDACGIVNANTETVSKNIERISKETGVDISENITNAWNGAGNAVSNFGNTVSSTTPGIISQISLITEQMTRLAEEAEKASQALVNATESNYGEHTTVGADGKQNTAKTGDFVIGSISSVGDIKKLRNAKNYIDDNITKPGRKDISTYHPLNQYIYKQTGGIITTSKQSGLAKALGINNIGSNPTDADKDRILKALKAAGFSNGGFVDAKTLIRSTGEDGIVLARHGEAILTPEQSRALLQIAPVFPKMLDVTNMVNNIPVRSNGAQAPVYNIDNSITVEGIATNEIVKDMENVATRQAEKVVTKINNMSYAKGVRRR